MELKWIAQLYSYMLAVMFFGFAIYFVVSVVYLLGKERWPAGRIMHRVRALIGCLVLGLLWALTDFLIFGPLFFGNPLTGDVVNGRYMMGLGRGDFVETTPTLWWTGLISIWLTRVLFAGSLLVLFGILTYGRFQTDNGKPTRLNA